jgi:dihydrofolate reductase
MRRLILKMSMSLDGYVGGPNGEIDWLIRSLDEGATAWIADTLWQAGLHVMGSRTYYDMVGYWPTSTDTLAEPINAISKAVFTRQQSLDLTAGLTTTALKDATRAREQEGGSAAASPSPDAASWTESKVLNGDLVEELERLKTQLGNDILAHGGAGFARSLVKLDLIDEFRLLIHPVALGNGLPLFADLPRPLKLVLRSASSAPSARDGS